MDSIFIGGISHSGTSIVRKCLKEHPDITGMEAELRFICDPDGFADALDDLTHRWSRHHGDRAVARLGPLLFQFSGQERRGSYKNSNFEEWLDPRYKNKVRDLVDDLTVEKVASPYRGFDSSSQTTFMTRRWDREVLARKFGKFVEELYESRDPDATHFAEDTPDNLTHDRYLREMFPDRKFIHVIRHPMDTMESLFKTGNTYGTDPVALARRNRHQMEMWWEQRRDTDDWWVVRLDKFAWEHETVMKRLFNRYLDIPWDEQVLDNRMDPERAHIGRYDGFFANHFGQDTEDEIKTILEPIAEAYSYEL